jgi:pimeloyl-ACP methyl ester carboxylesterase
VRNPLQQSVQLDDFSLDISGEPIAARRIRPARKSANGGPTMVFLHEALGCIAMWKDAPVQLSRMTRLPALIYDRHGHGKSGALAGPRGPDYLDREALEVLPDVLAACGVTDPILVGHSDGGSIALLYASRYPARALVTEAAHVFVEDVTVAGIRDAVNAWQGSDLKQKLVRYHGNKTDPLFAAWTGTWLSNAFASWNIEAALQDIDCPALVIQGEDDEYGTPLQLNAIAGGVSGAVRTMLLPECRHVPHLQAADRVLPAIAGFIADQLA